MFMPGVSRGGAYMVATLSGTDFKVEGQCDVDGDGDSSSYTATKSINAGMTTKNDTY